QRAVRRRLGRSDLRGIGVAVQGLGRVGRPLCGHLAGAGARLVVTDFDRAKVAEAVSQLPAIASTPEDIFDQPVEVFSPCALGDVISEQTLPRLKCSVVAGSANNQLCTPALADRLEARGILYAPDIVINAGGALGAAVGGGGEPEQVVQARLDRIGALLETVFTRAERERISTHLAAERL